MTDADGPAPISRRAALRRTAIAAGAVAAGGLLRPGLALAQSSGDEDLRAFLVEAIGLEQVTVLAYSTAAEAKRVDPKAKQTYEGFGVQEQAHVSALRDALDQLGFDAPDAPASAADTSVFDGIDGLEDEAVTRLTGRLGELEKARTADQLLSLLSKLEADQLTYYLQQGPELDSFDMATTSAEIAGCQAQHLLVLGEQGGDPPERAAAAVAAVIDKVPPPASTPTTTTPETTSTTETTPAETTSSTATGSG